MGANASRRCDCINWVIFSCLCFWICVWIFSDPTKGHLGAIASRRCYWVMCSCLCFWFCVLSFRLLVTQGKASRGQTPHAGVIALFGLCAHACVFGFVFGVLATQGKVTLGQSPLAGGVIGLCVHACVFGFVF